MNKKQVLDRLCNLTNTVAHDMFHHSKSADCFCGEGMEDYQVTDEEIIEFIEVATWAAIDAFLGKKRRKANAL